MKKIMVFGVFDLLHEGHRDFFKQAKALGDFLIVSVARDVNVEKIKKQKPVQKESERLQNVAAMALVDKALLGGIDDPWPHICEENPNIIALGYDQKGYVAEDLKKELQRKGLVATQVVRLKPFHPETYKSSLLRNNHTS